jgi:hypothetical protein
MSVWTNRRGRQLIGVLLMTGLLALGAALVAQAASTPDRLSGVGEGYPPLQATAAPVNVIVNGGFEDGFVEGQGVGVGWGRFESGAAMAGWYDDTWTKVVFEGKHAQLLELKNATQQDAAFIGILQTVNVVPGANYVLTLHGLIRSDEGSPDVSHGGYKMQYGIDFTGGIDWKSSNIEWVELPWNDQPRQDPTGLNVYEMDSATANITAQGAKLTLFIRGQKKWPDALEGNYDIDGVSLVGAQASATPAPTLTPRPTVPVSGTATTAPGLPKTGQDFGLVGEPVLAVVSAVMLVLLVGGAAWGVSRRRT